MKTCKFVHYEMDDDPNAKDTNNQSKAKSDSNKEEMVTNYFQKFKQEKFNCKGEIQNDNFSRFRESWICKLKSF
jgi:hypothetical protein